jgi:hypothetical protein
MQKLHRFLVDYDMAMLRALAQNRGIELATNRQIDAAAQMAKQLLDPLSVRTALVRLSPEARQVLDTLLAAQGRMRAPHFYRQFGNVRAIGSGRIEREAPWIEPANSTEELWYAGLIYRAFFQDDGGPGQFILIPDDLRPLLPAAVSQAPTFSVETVSEPATKASPDNALVHDLFVYLVHIQTHDVRPYADGRLSRRDLAALRVRMYEFSEPRVAFLRHLAERLGFVPVQDKCLKLDASVVRQWLSASTSQQLSLLQETWKADPAWNDLCRIPTLDCAQDASWQNDPVRTRQALLNLLAQVPVDAWWTVRSFVAAVKAEDPDFQRPDGDYETWYIRDRTSGEYLSGFESWDRVEGLLIADVLSRPLRWLGVLTTGNTAMGQVCRITESGVHFLGLAPLEKAAVPLSPSINVRPDFRIDLPQPPNLYTRFQLERFADLESLEPCTYRLTVDSLGRALGRKVRVEQILAFLRQASEGTVPANVAGQLQMWAGRFGQVRLEEITLLRVKNERAMRELSVLPETRDLIAKALSPTAALVRPKDLPRLRKALRTLGYLPPEEGGGEPKERG